MGNEEGIPKDLSRSAMCLYEGALWSSMTRVRVDSELPKVFEATVGIHQGSVLSPYPFTFLIDVVTEMAKEGVLSELLCADDLVLMSETIQALRNKSLKWKKAHNCNVFKVNIGQTKANQQQHYKRWLA